MPDQISQYINHYELTEDGLRTIFTEATRDNNSSTQFFSRFRYVYELFNGNPYAAFNQGLDLLNKCQAIDPIAYSRMHKGTPFYWLGSATYLMNDFESMAFFLEAAVTEDITKNLDPQKRTPAMKFILLEGELGDQAAIQLVKAAQNIMQRSIDIYNSLSGQPSGAENLTLPMLRTKLLEKIFLPDNKWRSIVTTMVSFGLEWDYRNELFDIRPSQGTNEPFFLHLFKGCLLFESLLKNNPTHPVSLSTRETNLGKILQLLHNELNINHDLPISDIDLPTILTNLTVPDDSLQKAIQFTGWLRNTLGHDLGWNATISKIQYQRLFEKVISSCLYAIARLY